MIRLPVGGPSRSAECLFSRVKLWVWDQPTLIRPDRLEVSGLSCEATKNWDEWGKCRSLGHLSKLHMGFSFELFNMKLSEISQCIQYLHTFHGFLVQFIDVGEYSMKHLGMDQFVCLFQTIFLHHHSISPQAPMNNAKPPCVLLKFRWHTGW